MRVSATRRAMRRLAAPPDVDPSVWLMSEWVQRQPADAAIDQVRHFDLRLGNDCYPHMKLRISRLPKSEEFVFSVDAHDAFLHAAPGSPDHAALEELKRHNAELAETILAAWEEHGLPTERTYLRRKLDQARQRRGGGE